MRNKFVFSSLMVALIVSGCAKRPNAVVPASLPSQIYANYNCKQLNELLLKEQANEKALANKQRGAADADAIGVILIGLPISGALGGDVEGELSVAKGKVLSIQSQQIANKCGLDVSAE